ncbi:hypothetical protein N7452_006471 [Penicillium brevicompactum]|uniref:N-acetyltransferase domain-containing protein n=1 Tax=Penicillium brevicompactum TaxID=5074 RepID=A0A9W9QRB3_PENBR|nr:hypothetical protein N7452_006471 [Penicillium brevicompactum]
MNLIQYAVEADGPALAKINVFSFHARLALGQIFPQSGKTVLQEYKTHVGMKHLANPNMHVLKIHSDNGEVAVYARWQLPPSFGQSLVTLSDQGALSAKDPVAFAPQPMNTAVFAAFKGVLEKSRKKYTTEEDIGLGYGAAMLKWGIEKADATKSRIYLEATPEGVPAYLKYGWKHVEDVRLDYADYGGAGVETYYIMIRDPIP